MAKGKALAYGHSFTGKRARCAPPKASLEVFEKRASWKIAAENEQLSAGLAKLRGLPAVNEVRRCGFIAGMS